MAFQGPGGQGLRAWCSEHQDVGDPGCLELLPYFSPESLTPSPKPPPPAAPQIWINWDRMVGHPTEKAKLILD